MRYLSTVTGPLTAEEERAAVTWRMLKAQEGRKMLALQQLASKAHIKILKGRLAIADPFIAADYDPVKAARISGMQELFALLWGEMHAATALHKQGQPKRKR